MQAFLCYVQQINANEYLECIIKKSKNQRFRTVSLTIWCYYITRLDNFVLRREDLLNDLEILTKMLVTFGDNLINILPYGK